MTSLPNDVRELALRTFEGLRDPRSLTAAIMVRYGEYDALCNLKCDPSDYLTSAAYAKAAAATSLLRKCADVPTSLGEDGRRKAAVSNWIAGESSCYHTNERLTRYLPEHSASADREGHVTKFLGYARALILRWIGPAPATLAAGRFGPGGTYSDRGDETTIPHKMSAVASVTHDALFFLTEWTLTSWGKHQCALGQYPEFVRGNRFSTVPKDALKDRAIGSEPAINVYFQLALGRQLRERLKGVGINLNSGQELHGQVVREASMTGHLATLDLSNASDTVAKVLVRLLLPPKWYSALDDLRSKSTFFPEGTDSRVKGWRLLEKFSSMGNGYTFELETLVFLALCYSAIQFDRAARQQLPVGRLLPVRMGSSDSARAWGMELSVYGDDIIVPTESARSVTAVLNYFGFSLNGSKSFSSGPFRESCGEDYFDGDRVRPFFIKEFPNDPSSWIVAANGIKRLWLELALYAPDVDLRRTWFHCLDQIPSQIRACRGPNALGDIVIHDDERFWSSRVRRNGANPRNTIRYIRVYRPHRHRKVKYGWFHPDVVLACATYGLGWGDGGVNPRDSVLSHKVGWKSYS
ncbi:TPA_asm: RNA-directed RNA polymerase [ssRNA phage SRR6255733_2]|uniref:RNA-directed RNA polymerase n=1 Tax=ssRNA phage SRR6255733_2 TaxID=2786498 RepID=A0A8S5L0I6_9VIRU|nr:RNA-directed RNA polymerase [ssRNA phage SRR6255733_2]DAD50948.1 TPA_asm: RNA-directed RNA polymerase [ssRNA phage SRR6255733_2]